MSPKILLGCVLSASVLLTSVPAEARIVHCGAHRRAVLQTIRLNNGARANRVTCVSTTQAVVRRAPHRSWKKSALVIGGSSAAGAGVGALVGGTKGALVGGVAGGAAGTAYEVHKRHHRKHRRRL
jgi:tetrahydromethanopterin S-methyltransferase subunit D